MADMQIKSSGNEVFNGNFVNLQAAKATWNFTRISKAPPLPGQWKPAETDAIGFTNPILTIDGVMNLKNTHAQNETGSLIDFDFLNEFVAASGATIFSDDVINATDNSDMFMEVRRWGFTMNARNQEAPDVRSQTQPYRLELTAASGTVWWSGTGIIT